MKSNVLLHGDESLNLSIQAALFNCYSSLRSRHLIITDDTESYEAQIAEKKGQQRED